MKFTYVIVDDDPAFTILLKSWLSEFPQLQFIGSFNSTISAGGGVEKLQPDILFLDIHIDILTGLDVLKVLEVLPKPPKTIIVSSAPDYQDIVGRHNVYDYLIKPIDSSERLKEAIDKVTI